MEPDNRLYRLLDRHRMNDRRVMRVFAVALALPLVFQGCTLGGLEVADWFGWLPNAKLVTDSPVLIPPPDDWDPDWPEG